jgi:hypothetical protein
MPPNYKPPEMEFCGKNYWWTRKDDICPDFKEELFDATPNSTQTEEFEIGLTIEADFEKQTFKRKDETSQ